MENTEVKKQKPLVEELFDINQICIQLCISGRNLRVAKKKYLNMKLTAKSWSTKLKKDKLLK